MSPGLPNSKRNSPAFELRASDAEQKAVETFTIEVSAGHRTGKTPRPKSRNRKKSKGLAPLVVKAPAASERVQTSQPAAPPIAFKSDTRTTSSAQITAATVEPLRRSGTPPWLVSLAVHAAVLLVLSFFTLATLQREDLALWASSAPRDEFIEEFPELEIDPSVELDALDTELPTELEDPGLASFGDLSAEAELSEVSANVSLAASELGEMGNLFGNEGHALSDLGAGDGGATTTFFGTEVKANRVLFMLDNSGGMGFNGKFETLVVELLRSVDSMDPKQQFYVIFYSDTVYPLYFPHSEMRFVRATTANKQRLRDWLGTVELCMGNAIDVAIEAADVIRPDIVCLLTDGELFTTQKKKSIMLDGSDRRYPIHTFGMGIGREKYAEQLQLVADANRGTYRAVQVSPEAVKLSKTIRRPYHDWKNGPGSVWGTSFADSNRWQKKDDEKAGQE